mmetsp:Transcript_42322/g.92191  ORF Transcript_42322/g.92191 Transcript_42322/m.92191 type:complete len:201 (-) Transcript_42322:508-1110(-)
MMWAMIVRSGVEEEACLSSEVETKCLFCSSLKNDFRTVLSCSSPAFAASLRRFPPSRISLTVFGESEKTTLSISDGSTIATLTMEQKRSRKIQPLLPGGILFRLPKGARLMTTMLSPGSSETCRCIAAVTSAMLRTPTDPIRITWSKYDKLLEVGSSSRNPAMNGPDSCSDSTTFLSSCNSTSQRSPSPGTEVDGPMSAM